MIRSSLGVYFLSIYRHLNLGDIAKRSGHSSRPTVVEGVALTFKRCSTVLESQHWHEDSASLSRNELFLFHRYRWQIQRCLASLLCHDLLTSRWMSPWSCWDRSYSAEYGWYVRVMHPHHDLRIEFSSPNLAYHTITYQQSPWWLGPIKVNVSWLLTAHWSFGWYCS